MHDRRRLADLLAEWQDLLDRGGDPDPEGFLAAHPGESGALRELLDCLPLVDLAFAPPIRVPSTIGPYRILRRIGAGGMGTVYLAETGPDCACCRSTGRVALKVLHAHLPGLPGFLERFRREAELGGRVAHENVVRTLCSDSARVGARTVHFLVTEYVEGHTLRELLRRLGTVPEALLREVARQIAAGLAAIHAAGIVHRDLKPENVMVTHDHRVRLMDLGLARPFGRTSTPGSRGTFAGTLLYAAPEQFDGREVGPAADLYSLGVVMHELAAGANPFRRDRPSDVRVAHLRSPAPVLDRAPSGSSPFLAAVVSGLLEKAPADRLGPAAAVAGILERGEQSPWWTGRGAGVAAGPGRRPEVLVRRDTRLVGRGEDLAALRTAWERARAGQGGAVFLEGEAGIGKSRLLDAFFDTVDGEDAFMMYGSYAPACAAGALAEALTGLFGEQGLVEAFKRYLPESGEALAGVVTSVRDHRQPVGGEAVPMERVHGLSVRLVRALSAERPLLMILDDVHFAEVSVRSLLLSLCQAAEGHRILVVLAARPGVPEEELAPFAREPSFHRHRIARLGPGEVTELLRETLGNAGLAERLGDRIAERSGGVPFFVFEMIRLLREERLIVPLHDGSFADTGAIAEIRVPAVVRDLVSARLRGISPAERAVLEVGAVEGTRFDPDLAARVLGRTLVDVLECLGRLERHARVVRTEGIRCRFDHHLIEETLRAELSEGRREEIHERLAEACVDREGLAGRDPGGLPGEAAVFLARHGLRGRRPERGLPFLSAALEQLSASFQSGEAVALAAFALGRPGLLEGEARARVLLAQAQALGVLGKIAEQGEAVRELSALAESMGDPRFAGLAAWHLGTWHGNESRWTEAETAFRRAIAHSIGAGDAELEGQARGSLGHTLRHFGRFDEARAEYECARRIARARGASHSEGRAEESLGTLFGMQGRYAESWACFVRSLDLCHGVGDLEGERTARWFMGLQRVYLGDHSEGRTHLAESLRLAQVLGCRHGEASVMLIMGLSHLRCGEFEPARGQLERCLVLRRELRDRTGESVVAGHLGQLHTALGRYEDAMRFLRVQFEIARETGERVGVALASAFLGPVLGACGDAREARRMFGESIPICRELSLRRVEGYALHGLAVVAAQEGEREEARSLFREALALRRAIGYAPGLAATLCALGGSLIETGDLDAARECLVEARETGHRLAAQDPVVLASCHLARLPGGDGAAAEAELRAREACLGVPARMEAWFLLHRVTGDPDHLARARGLLSHLVEHAPPAAHVPMLERVPLHRQIAVVPPSAG